MKFSVGKCHLRELLKKRGLNQTELALKLGVTPQQINHYITRKRVMTLSTAKSISTILNCDIEDLYDFLPDDTRE